MDRVLFGILARPLSGARRTWQLGRAKVLQKQDTLLDGTLRVAHAF